MKIMHEQEPWPTKVNFVDENNVALGYDLDYQCCEMAGWFLSDKPGDSLEETFEEKSMDLEGWVFDREYFVERGGEEIGDKYKGYVEFRIVKGDEQKFITIYNHHNGYYSHGFKFDCPQDPSKNKKERI